MPPAGYLGPFPHEYSDIRIDAQAKMAERKAQREQLREIRERSEAQAAEATNTAGADVWDRRASKKRRKENDAKVCERSLSI